MRWYILSQVRWISDRELGRIAAMLALTGGECAADYGAETPTVEVVSGAVDIPSDGSPLVLSETIDAPGDLAYHTVLDGRPYALVLAPLGTSLGDVQERASHEVNEGIGDPFVNRMITLPSGDMVMQENCDPAQGQRRLIDLGEGDRLASANYVKLRWFVAGARADDGGGLLDAAGLFSVSLEVGIDGYMMIITPDGSTRMVGAGPVAMRGPLSERARVELRGKEHPAFRHGKRLAFATMVGQKLRSGLGVAW